MDEQKEAVKYCDKLKKPRTIAELTKERLRRAGKKIREEWEAQNSSREGAKEGGASGQLFSESDPLRDFAASLALGQSHITDIGQLSWCERLAVG